MLGTGARLQDQRGPDGAAFLWTGESTAYCFIGRTDEGNLQSPFGAWRQTVLTGSLELEGNEPGPPSMVTGAVDPAAAVVEIETASGLLLRATTGDGRFLAWWPGKDPYVADPLPCGRRHRARADRAVAILGGPVRPASVGLSRWCC